MRYFKDRRVLLAGAFVAVAALASLFLAGSRDVTDPSVATRVAVEAADELASRPYEVTLRVSLSTPGANSPTIEKFRGEGVVNGSRAGFTYDFEDIANAAGFFGHLDEFDVVFESEITYIEVFVDGPPWLAMAPSDASDPDVDRLRELNLSSPLLLPALMENLGDASGRGEGGTTAVSGSVDIPAATDAAPGSYGELLSELGVTRITVELESVDGRLRRVVYEFAIPQGGKEVTARVEADISEGDGEISPIPPEDEVKRFADF